MFPSLTAQDQIMTVSPWRMTPMPSVSGAALIPNRGDLSYRGSLSSGSLILK